MDQKVPLPQGYIDHLERLKAARDGKVDPRQMLEALGKLSRGETTGVESELNESK